MKHLSTSYKIVADSSSDILSLSHIPFASAPLKISTAEHEYTDDENLDLAQMVDDFLHQKGKSSSSCPNVNDWLERFDDAEHIFCVTISSNLSGSYNAACLAKDMYESEHPDRKVFVVDSLLAGPGLALIIEKLEELILSGMAFEDICTTITDYKKKSSIGVFFMLESMRNLANNGRVSPAVAKLAGMLGIRLIGKDSEVGTLEMTDKCRGEKKALDTMIKHIKDLGYKGGKLRICHCFNENAANYIKDKILSEFKEASVKVYIARGLCSFYAEKGGLILGYETL